MWRATACGLLVAILSAAFVQAQNITEATAAEHAYLQKLPEALGKLGTFNASSKQFTLLVEYQTGPPRAAGPAAEIQRLSQQLWREQQLLAVSPSPRVARDRMANIQRMQIQLVRAQGQFQSQAVKNAGKGPQGPFKQFEMAATDKAEVRMGFLPVRYDDKGNLKEFSKEELVKLRGKDNKPGIPAGFDDLTPGQLVKVVFAKSSQKPASSASKKKSEDAPAETSRLQVATIVILAESTDRNNPKSSGK